MYIGLAGLIENQRGARGGSWTALAALNEGNPAVYGAAGGVQTWADPKSVSRAYVGSPESVL
jgi:hypothetical protein